VLGTMCLLQFDGVRRDAEVDSHLVWLGNGLTILGAHPRLKGSEFSITCTDRSDILINLFTKRSSLSLFVPHRSGAPRTQMASPSSDRAAVVPYPQIQLRPRSSSNQINIMKHNQYSRVQHAETGLGERTRAHVTGHNIVE